MNIKSTNLSEVKIIEPQIFKDHRGYFLESYKNNIFREADIKVDFVQDNISKSTKGTLRGLHYQKVQPQAKLVKCIYGTILDVAVDIRTNSKTFAQYVAVKLSEDNHKQMYVPEGFAHGFLVLSEEAIVYYKCSTYYHKQSERGIIWNDPQIGINWGIKDPILSNKDKDQPKLTSLI